MTFNAGPCADAVSDPALLATDLADYLVSRGVPFREAHHAVGAAVALAERRKCRITELATADMVRINRGFGADWASVFDLGRAVEMRKGTGMPGTAQLARQLARWAKALA
jgi:argininosuccinate lyase